MRTLLFGKKIGAGKVWKGDMDEQAPCNQSERSIEVARTGLGRGSHEARVDLGGARRLRRGKTIFPDEDGLVGLALACCAIVTNMSRAKGRLVTPAA
jgi:hypothetical protein